MSDQNDLPEAAKRALAEAEERRKKRKSWNFPKNWADARGLNLCGMGIGKRKGSQSIFNPTVAPVGIFKPRKNVSASWADLPARCNFCTQPRPDHRQWLIHFYTANLSC